MYILKLYRKLFMINTTHSNTRMATNHGKEILKNMMTG